MPYAIIKHSDGTASVKNKETGRISASHTTMTKAKAQMRLLNAIESGSLLKKKRKS